MKYFPCVLAAALTLGTFSAFAGQVNINEAPAAAIASELSGVGAAKAQLIVDFRQQNGPFKAIDELALVKGIGQKTVETNRKNIRLKSTK